MKIEKIIGRKMLFEFSFIFLLLFVPLVIYMINEKRENMLNDQKMVLEEVIEQWDNTKVELEDEIAMFDEDYISKAETVEYLLERMGSKEYTTEELSEIAKTMQLDVINLIDHTGEVVYSSNPQLIGECIKSYEERREFWPLVDGTSDKSVIQKSEVGMVTGIGYVLGGIKSNLPEFSMIQIGLLSSSYERVIHAFTLETLITRIPTEREKAIFAVYEETGDLLAITKNNDQTVSFQDGESKEEFLQQLKNHRSHFTIKINDDLKHLTVVEHDGYLFATWTDSSYTYRNAIPEVTVMILVLAATLWCIYVAVARLIRKYVIKDLKDVDYVIESILSGNVDVQFNKMKSFEFKLLSSAIDKWKEDYKNKSERLTKIVEKIDTGVAVFECHHNINKVFYSENIKDLLSVNDTNLKIMAKDTHTFQHFIMSIKNREDVESIVNIGEKYISIDASLDEDGIFYGVIVDKTEGMLRMKSAERQLERAIDESKKDGLTGLYNRKGIEEEIINSLEQNPSSGIMMMLDLDNFKEINDNEGHQVGDYALQLFANCLKENFRTEDMIARMGGDEFVVFIHTNLSRTIMEQKCRDLLRKSQIVLKEYYDKYKVSVSIGVAYASSKANTYEQLYRLSDTALYKAKKDGKNTFHFD